MIKKNWISVEKASPNFLWFKISKTYTKTTKDIFVCGAYIPPYSSNYFHPELFEDLESDIENYSSQGSVLLMGDLNSRTGKYPDSFSQEGSHNIITNDQSEYALSFNQRNCFDNELNNHGKRLLEICRSATSEYSTADLVVIHKEEPRFMGETEQASLITQCDQDLFSSVAHFAVKEPSFFSDHSPVITWLNVETNICNKSVAHANGSLKRLPRQFC